MSNRELQRWIVVLGLVVAVGVPGMAASPTDAFSTCLTDTLNGKERKALAKWVFFAMAAHPEMSPFSSATKDDIESTDKFVGALVTRLLTVDCPKEFKAASESDPTALEKAFGVVGEIAMQELMANDAVVEAISNYGKYADMDKVEEVLAQE